ncbi:MAG: HD domain-containing protein, partial [Flavipsychrobacter sp.]
DKILSMLCKMIVLRKLYKVQLSSQSLASILEQKRQEIKNWLGIDDNNLHYLAFTGITSNSTYNVADEQIQIAMKDGTVKDISEIDNSLVNQALARPVHKNYICYVQP